MIKVKQVMLFTVVLLLLVGVACASEVSEDTTDISSVTEKAVTHDTYKVADTANSKNDNIYENVNSSQSFNNNMDKNNSKTIEKNRNPDVKTAPSISDWIDLKSAVSSAKGKEVTLTLKKGTYKNNGVIRWDNVDTKLTIDGNGQTIDGNKQLAFSIQKGSSLVLKNITIKNCEAGYGGAIVNYGKLTIIQSTFTNNSARTIYGAGAIFNNEILNITQSNFTDNAGANGGAIQNNKTGKTDITQSIFKNNHVINVIGAGFGGAIDNEGTMTITKSTLTNNSAKHGGAIYNGKSLTITDSTLANNTAEKGGAIKQLMGANAVGNINIARNTFINNHANNNKETVDLGEFDKGQTESNVYKSTDISIKRLNLNVKDNQTIFHTGEDVVINLDIGNLEHPNFYDKDILKKLEDITIYINGVENVTTKIKNYTLSNLKPGNYSVYYKTCNQKSNTITFIVTSVSNWQELQEAVRDAESQTEDTTIYLMKGNYTNTGTIEWINPNITLTIEGNGQTIDGNQLQAFNINSRSSMILKNITIINAKSKLGGAIQNNGNLTVTQSTLANNTAEDGGAIENTGTLTVIQSRLTGNTAKYDGGAINNKYDLNITESILSDNMASEYGGAIFNDQHLFSVVGSNFTNDNAKRGGAIFSIGNANLTGNTFIKNTADNNETIDLYLQGRADADGNVYESTDIAFRKIALSIKDNKNSFTPYDDVVLNFTIGLRNPKYYDSDILERLEDITIYVNGVEYATTKYENYTLSDLKPGKYTLYYTTCNQKSNSVTFKVIGQSNITTPENSYDYIEGIPDTITLNINDSSSQKGTAIITVKEASEYKQLLSLTNITDGYEVSTESIVNALEKMYDNLDDSYTINITYTNDYVTSSSTEFTLNIIKQVNTSINISTQTTPTHLIVTVKDNNQNPINHGTITTNITPISYYPDDNGQVFIPLKDLKEGRYHANVTYTENTGKTSIKTDFNVTSQTDIINVTTDNVEMLHATSVSLAAKIGYNNRTINFGKVYFTIDDKPLVDENGFVLYGSVKDNWAEFGYDMPADVSLGNHNLCAVYVASNNLWTKDDKTLTIIEYIPEGAGSVEDDSSSESISPQRYWPANTGQKSRPNTIQVTQTINSNGHKITTGNNMIPTDNVLTLGNLNELFNQTFLNGHLLLYIDGELVFNGTVGDDLATVILEIIEKFLGEHELKVEFTDSNNQTQTYTKNVTIT